jgi:hypothetical protein
MTLEARKKYTAENKEKNLIGGGPHTTENYSPGVQEIISICEKQYFEGDTVVLRFPHEKRLINCHWQAMPNLQLNFKQQSTSQ